MDPSSGSAPPTCWRFPRPRGDGPAGWLAQYNGNRVSPPTRGWTVDAPTTAPIRSGFPAHAGMDRRGSRRAGCRSWFPRPRGDGPERERIPLVDPRVSPPTRGWTRAPMGDLPTGQGFPAHAGMDQLRPRDRGGRVRFPRPRGDGPREASPEAFRSTVSPPTRGWTRSPSRRPATCRGFPAHAGMDLSRAQEGQTCRGFPRPRGDGPGYGPTTGWRSPVSPPTRGWTRGFVDHRAAVAGFPAHAGMDP